MPLSAKRRWCKTPCKLQPYRHSSPQRCEFEPAKHYKCCRGCLHLFKELATAIAIWQSGVFFTCEGVRSVGQLATLGPGPLGFATGGVRHVHGLVKLENLVPQPKPIEGVARRLAAPHASPGEILAGGEN